MQLNLKTDDDFQSLPRSSPKFDMDAFSPRRIYLDMNPQGNRRMSIHSQTPETKTLEFDDSPQMRRSIELDRWISEVKRERRNSDATSPGPIKPQNITNFLLQNEVAIEEIQLVKYLQEIPDKQKFAVANLFVLSLGANKSAKSDTLIKILTMMKMDSTKLDEILALLARKQDRYLPLQFWSCKVEEKYRWIVVWSFFVLFLTIEKYYDSRVRCALVGLAYSLDVKASAIYADELAISTELADLLKNVREEQRLEDKRTSNDGRYLLFGALSALGGGAMLLTGGLAAPVVLPVLSSIMASVGLIGTVGGIGTVSSVVATKKNLKLTNGGILISNLFGRTCLTQLECERASFEFHRIEKEYYSSIILKKVTFESTMSFDLGDRLQKDILLMKPEDEYDPKNDLGYLKSLEKFKQKFRSDTSLEPSSLNLLIGVSGFTYRDTIENTWSALKNEIMGEMYTLVWEKDLLYHSGEAIQQIIESERAPHIRKFWYDLIAETKSTNTISIMQTAQWPSTMFDRIFNPLGIMLSKSAESGTMLAKVLMAQVQGKRPVSLIGISHGANVIFSCLEELAKNNVEGIIENVFLIGATVSCSSSERWGNVRKIIPGRFVNAYSLKDWVLVYLYRSLCISYEIAGLQPCFEKLGVQNVDVSEFIQGHHEYEDPLKLSQIWALLEIENCIKVDFTK